MLDESRAYNDMTPAEVSAVAAHLCQSVPAFATPPCGSFSFESVELIVKASRVVDMMDNPPQSLFSATPPREVTGFVGSKQLCKRNEWESVCTVILAGQATVQCGEDGVCRVCLCVHGTVRRCFSLQRWSLKWEAGTCLQTKRCRPPSAVTSRTTPLFESPRSCAACGYHRKRTSPSLQSRVTLTPSQPRSARMPWKPPVTRLGFVGSLDLLGLQIRKADQRLGHLLAWLRAHRTYPPTSAPLAPRTWQRVVGIARLSPLGKAPRWHRYLSRPKQPFLCCTCHSQLAVGTRLLWPPKAQ